ncbi:MAG: hypothetical protein RL660_1604 [Bacteroidota bacterium]|jgi:two-component system LytT family response regulator
MYNAIIVDDEQHCITTLQWLINNYLNDTVNIVASTTNAKEAVALVQAYKPHIVFLDIEMPHKSGIEIANELATSSKANIIFTTAYDKYAVKAIKLSALDYLLKPIDSDELQAAIQKIDNLAPADNTQQLEELKQMHKSKMLNKIALRTGDGLIFVQLTDIMYVEGEGAYSKFMLRDGKHVLISKSLSAVVDILDDSYFFRPHKSYVINLQFIEKYIRGEGGEIIMQNGASIALSRTKKEEFLQLFGKV